jgi:predicted transcriptional regulator
MNEKFLKVEDVMQILGISKSAAYKIMRQMNDELLNKGYVVIRGKVSRKYFEERFYGMNDAG